MREKKQKGEIKKHRFEIHTMEGDNENKKFISEVDVVVKKQQPKEELKPLSKNSENLDLSKQDTQPFDTSKLEKVEAYKIPAKPVSYIKQTNTAENPFTNVEKLSTAPNSKKGTFALNKENSDIEKINKSPKDMLIKNDAIPEIELINKEKDFKDNKKKKSSLGAVIIIMIILVIVLTVFGIYSQKDSVINLIEKYIAKTHVENQINNDIQNVDITNDDLIKDVEEEIVTQMYSSEFPNYFSVDIESEKSEENISSELMMIANNMKSEGIGGPISFIVTDANNNPVSFNVFAISADMKVPQEVMSLLEENFEIYAFNDIDNGIRFGFVVDVKDSDGLQNALLLNEALLPKAFDIILDGAGSTTKDILFGDSAYETHPIRFDNLDEEKTYSIDYAINDKRLLLGTSKNTIRAMIDYLKRGGEQSNVLEVEEILSTSKLPKALKNCEELDETFVNPLSGENAHRRIIGIENGLCVYEQEMLNGGKMQCKYDEELRMIVADYNEPNTDSSAVINGVEVSDVLQYTLEEGHCIIYDANGVEV